MSIPGRSHLCWTPESLVGRLACVARQVSPGRGCLLTNSSLTHSLPVFLDLVLSVQGFFSQIVVGRPCLFLTCHWLLADFCRVKTSCARISVSQMFFSILSLVGSISPCLFNVWLWTSSSGSLPLWSCLRLGWLFLVNFSSIEFDTIDFCLLLGLTPPRSDFLLLCWDCLLWLTVFPSVSLPQAIVFAFSSLLSTCHSTLVSHSIDNRPLLPWGEGFP